MVKKGYCKLLGGDRGVDILGMKVVLFMSTNLFIPMMAIT
ncbi:hypothetical protein BTN50_1527 [Candidatus Enterovibrio altilux]|uniref:Uncharacterized protein n=1 Tax=Candidatus Enterovibrio altilux TaxID=1927128 RepID=A0A291BAG9_9GAMM|nr:hypothetical protein BTN50_1527 [Candidatus Enterovibrio luxaltus]